MKVLHKNIIAVEHVFSVKQDYSGGRCGPTKGGPICKQFIKNLKLVLMR